MDLGPYECIVCPHCIGTLQWRKWLSMNTFGATYWSDGWLDGPMVPFESSIAICGRCNGFFWVEEVASLGYVVEHGENRTLGWMFSPYAQTLSHDECLMALRLEVWSTVEQQTILRTLTWQLANEPYRDVDNLRVVELSSADMENLDALRRRLRSRRHLDRLVLIDIARQLGEFEEAERLLRMTMGEKYSDVVEQMKRWVERRDRRLLPFVWGEE